MQEEATVLIVGAGPFGLALAAELKRRGIDAVVAGRQMSFWREHMPAGMLLRSGVDWHLDTADEATLSAFLREPGQTESEAMPLSRDRYVDYVDWFVERKQLEITPFEVENVSEADGGIVATGRQGSVASKAVVVATGFRPFTHVPPELASLLPEGRFGHTAEVVDFTAFRGRRVLIVGGRQSAFESAALLAEAGAVSVDLVYRHETPQFTASDWSWVGPLMQRTEVEPGWYRALSDEARRELNGRFWAEGRLKLEPWLAPRIDVPRVHLHAGTEIGGADEESGGLVVTLKDGERVETDFVLFATGYRVDVSRLGFLGSLSFETRNGFPVLDTSMQSSLPGLYFTSIAATQDFGPFFAFTVSARCSARLIAGALTDGMRQVGLHGVN